MRPFRTKAWIITAALCLAVVGCSSLRLAYGNAAQLAWWWIDGYFDFSSEQSPQARQAVDDYFDWHRRTQLASYVSLLRQAQGRVAEPITPAGMCGLYEDWRAALEPSLQQVLVSLSDLVPLMSERQLRQLEKRYAKNDQELRDDFLQADPAERLEKSVQRAVDRAETLYGRLEEAQRRVLQDGVAASPFNPEKWLVDRQRRQRDTLQTLRKLIADRAEPPQRVAALKALAQRFERSPDPEYRAYQLRLIDDNCALASRLHNATTAAQRAKARRTLAGWEGDFRSFIGAAAAP